MGELHPGQAKRGCRDGERRERLCGDCEILLLQLSDFLLYYS